LQAGPYEDRPVYDFAAAVREQAGDLDITQVGREQKMPWEIDGPKWHTQDRVGRTGNPCRWDGKVLATVVERIHELGSFSETDWTNRSVVEIAAAKKSDGWFFHAITGEEFLLKMKFRTAGRTFQRQELVARLGMTPLNDLHELPVYGTDPRVRVKNLRGPWQEVELRVYRWEEIDHPDFWSFLDEAVAGFERLTQKKQERPQDVMPWKVLGQKWHFSRKGFPLGKSPQWPAELLEELCELLSQAAPDGQFLWNNQQLVHLLVPVQDSPWATILTKKAESVTLRLSGPKGHFALGRILHLGCDRSVKSGEDDKDVIRIRFRAPEDLYRTHSEHGDLATFLAAHLASLASPAAT
jgi:excinuclease ABC subunit A